jgi:hypothetical protein
LQITGLSRTLFADVLKRIAIAKFPDAPTEAQAYKYLVEKHIALGARRANEDVKDFEDVIRKWYTPMDEMVTCYSRDFQDCFFQSETSFVFSRMGPIAFKRTYAKPLLQCHEATASTNHSCSVSENLTSESCLRRLGGPFVTCPVAKKQHDCMLDFAASAGKAKDCVGS